MAQVILGLRENVYVRLTQQGILILRTHLSEKGINIINEHGKSPRKEEESDYLIRDNWYCFNLVKLMYIFGGEALKVTVHSFVDDKIYTEPPE
jgi:hypothetical protein